MTLPRTPHLPRIGGLLLSIAIGLPAAPRAAGVPSEPADGGRLHGTWRVEVTLVDCATGSERPPFWSLVTFAGGGTATDTTANQSFPGQRTPGHGTWVRTGRGTYEAATEAFILFGPALRPWIHRIEQEIALTGADTFSTRATVRFALAPGAQPPSPVPVPAAPLCATARGYRF